MSDSQGPTVVTVSVVFAVLTAIVMSMRLYARVFIVQKLGLDDVLISVAALLSIAFIVATIMAVEHGLGDHVQDVYPKRGMQNYVSYLQIVWLSSVFYNACLGFIKTSVLALYMRLGDRALKRLAQVMIGVVAAQAGANVLVCIFQCSPVSGAYDLKIAATAKCVNINAFYLANAAVNIFTDLLTYTLPIKLVMRLQVPRQQKIGLGVMLCLGLFACISSIIRITFVPAMLTSADATYAISGAMYWSVIETNVGILAASIPSFKVIAKRYAPRLLGSYYESNHYPSGNKSRSGFSSKAFHKMGSSQHGGTMKSNASVALRSMNRDEGGGGGTGNTGFKNKTAVQTHIEQDVASNSSEEALTLPDGRIGVRTHITTQYDTAARSQSGHSDAGSLYETVEGKPPVQSDGRL
ncbi:uncharacterized protein K452DRAFT_289805 [Aplosporella prunicola CBS 121167]|uniref:Rhodopsin domain-containing protein n=1 Tax=Aplosporella prunicola CBS 121167 TaxID=1176127 RepID=A0A6A6B9T3_9PEZI|nr:uncharacterized protein K452DRAFT_289805 [Aplosporella prunicola CBS 121167]KAF2139251.1 hypothetical protein K452DRAFT_289805 [Aplosporella prunicola CBS 121167]